MKVYLKEEIPDRFPCCKKIQPVIPVADDGSVCVCVCMCVQRSNWTNSWYENPLIEIKYKGTNFWEVSEQPTAWTGWQGYPFWASSLYDCC